MPASIATLRECCAFAPDESATQQNDPFEVGGIRDSDDDDLSYGVDSDEEAFLNLRDESTGDVIEGSRVAARGYSGAEPERSAPISSTGCADAEVPGAVPARSAPGGGSKPCATVPAPTEHFRIDSESEGEMEAAPKPTGLEVIKKWLAQTQSRIEREIANQKKASPLALLEPRFADIEGYLRYHSSLDGRFPAVAPATKKKDKGHPRMPTLNGAGANVTKENTHTDREALRRSVGYGFHASMKTCMVAELVKNKDILKSSEARAARRS